MVGVVGVVGLEMWRCSLCTGPAKGWQVACLWWEAWSRDKGESGDEGGHEEPELN